MSPHIVFLLFFCFLLLQNTIVSADIDTDIATIPMPTNCRLPAVDRNYWWLTAGWSVRLLALCLLPFSSLLKKNYNRQSRKTTIWQHTEILWIKTYFPITLTTKQKRLEHCCCRMWKTSIGYQQTQKHTKAYKTTTYYRIKHY